MDYRSKLGPITSKAQLMLNMGLGPPSYSGRAAWANGPWLRYRTLKLSVTPLVAAEREPKFFQTQFQSFVPLLFPLFLPPLSPSLPPSPPFSIVDNSLSTSCLQLFSNLLSVVLIRRHGPSAVIRLGHPSLPSSDLQRLQLVTWWIDDDSFSGTAFQCSESMSLWLISWNLIESSDCYGEYCWPWCTASGFTSSCGRRRRRWTSEGRRQS